MRTRHAPEPARGVATTVDGRVAAVLAWYAREQRDLPWRATGRTPWSVLVSEVMLQQTPVARVLPVWRTWLQRWPTPAALAAEPAGEAVRAWGRLGYPRRALRLHAAATECVSRFGGDVPTDLEDLRSLPGVGEYTAAAVVAFAHGGRATVLDTNVRRVLARLVAGRARPGPSITRDERATATDLLPDAAGLAATWSVAVMELGALVCTASSPACGRCPVAGPCVWRAAGYPPDDGPPRRVQAFAGTDRQVRGLLLAVLREHVDPVPGPALDAVWADPVQRARALDGLVSDGLVELCDDDRFRLPA